MNNTTNGFWMLLLNRFYSHPRIPGTTSLFRCIQWQPYFGPNDICSAISETTKPIIVITAEPLRTSFRFSFSKVASFFLPKYDVWSLQNPLFCKNSKYICSTFVHVTKSTCNCKNSIEIENEENERFSFTINLLLIYLVIWKDMTSLPNYCKFDLFCHTLLCVLYKNR